MWHYINTEKFKCSCKSDNNGIVIRASGIIKKFIGQPFHNVRKWLFKQNVSFIIDNRMEKK